MAPILEGVLKDGRDGMLATLGVTGSGKTHTILGNKQARGMTQMSLDVLFKSLSDRITLVGYTLLLFFFFYRSS